MAEWGDIPNETKLFQLASLLTDGISDERRRSELRSELRERFVEAMCTAELASIMGLDAGRKRDAMAIIDEIELAREGG